MEKHETRVQRLRELVEKDGGPAAFARLRSQPSADKPIDPTFVSQILSGHRSFGEKAAANMARRAGLPSGYFDGQGQGPAANVAQPPQPPHADYVQLEIHDVRMSAGAGAECIDRSDIVANLPVLKSWALENLGTANPEYVKLVTCAGISMQPTIDDGSLMFVDVRVREYRGDGIYCLAWNEHLIVKRLIADVLSGNLRIVSDNPDKTYYPDQIATPAEADRLTILGQVRRWFKTCKP